MGGIIEFPNGRVEDVGQSGFGPGQMAPSQPLGDWPFPNRLPKCAPTTSYVSPAPAMVDNGLMQKFATGATRSSDVGKNHYDGFLSMPAIEEFGDYMTRHRVQPDGSLRDPDNWQKGMPLASYVGSLLRHTLELVGLTRGYVSKRMRRELPQHVEDLDFLKRETACAIWFNVQGFLHVTLQPPPAQAVQTSGFVQQAKGLYSDPSAPLVGSGNARRAA